MLLSIPRDVARRAIAASRGHRTGLLAGDSPVCAGSSEEVSASASGEWVCCGGAVAGGDGDHGAAHSEYDGRLPEGADGDASPRGDVHVGVGEGDDRDL